MDYLDDLRKRYGDDAEELKRSYHTDLVNVISPEGVAGTLPSSELDAALQYGFRRETPYEEHARLNPLDAKITSFGLGLADAMTFGATKPFRQAVGDPARLRELEAMQAQEPGYGLAGTAAGFLGGLPAMKVVGKLGQAAQARGAGPLARYAVEGAALAAPETVTELALGNPEAAAEKLVYGASVGAVLGGVIGAGKGISSSIGGAVKGAAERRVNVIDPKSPYVVSDTGLLANTLEKHKLSVIPGEEASQLAARLRGPKHEVWSAGKQELDRANPVSVFTEEEALAAPKFARGFVTELSIPGSVDDTLQFIEKNRNKLNRIHTWGEREQQLSPFVMAAEDRILSGTSVGLEHGALTRMHDAAMAYRVKLPKESAWTGVTQLVGGKVSTALGGAVGSLAGGFVGAGIGGMVGSALGQGMKQAMGPRAPAALLSAISKHGQQMERVNVFSGRLPEPGMTLAQRMFRDVDVHEAAANPLVMEPQLLQATAGVSDNTELTAFTASKFHQIAQYLSAHAPQKPGAMFGSAEPGAPNPADMKSYRDRSEIAYNPYAIVNHVRNGTLTKEHVETIEALAPNIWEDIRDKIVDDMSKKKTLPFTSRAVLARIYNMEGDPAWSQIQSYQAAYAPTQTPMRMPKPRASTMTPVERITAR